MKKAVPVLPPDILAGVANYGSLVEAVAKMRTAIVDAHVPELLQQLDKFWKQHCPPDTIVSEAEELAEKIATDLRKIMPWEDILEVTSFRTYDEEGEEYIDSHVSHIAVAANKLYRLEQQRKNKGYSVDPEDKLNQKRNRALRYYYRKKNKKQAALSTTGASQ